LTFRVVSLLWTRMRAAIRFVTVLVLVLSLGLHWAFLQSVAWVSMIVTYSHEASFTEAVSKTFDGKHPCCMCKAIKKARAEENQKDEKQHVKPGSKMDLGLVWQASLLSFSSAGERIPSANSEAFIRSYEPPKPRPRTA